MKLTIPEIAVMTMLLIACNNSSKNNNPEIKDTLTAPDTSKAQTADTLKPKATTDTLVKQEPLLVYTCPMHPEVIGKKGNKCPKCGMALELKK